MKKLINSKNIIHTSIVLMMFLFGMWYFCLRILGTHLEYIPGDKGDSRLVNYLLEHGYCWLTGKTNSFWNAGFMYPFDNTIALSDTMIGPQLFYFPLRILGFLPETSYQVWWLITCSLNFWSAYWVFNKIFKNNILAAILAWVFAFSILHLGQLNYPQLTSRFPIPIAFYAAYRFTNATSIKYLAIYCTSIVFQFCCTPYIGFYLFYFSLLFILVYTFLSTNTKTIVEYCFNKSNRIKFILILLLLLIVLSTRSHLIYFSLLFILIYLTLAENIKEKLYPYFNKSNRVKVILVLIFTAAIPIVFFIPYYSMSKIVGLRMYNEIVANLPPLKSYFLPHESSIPWRFLFEITKVGQEQWWILYLFPGFILLSVLLVSPVYLIYTCIIKNKISVFLTSLIVVILIITALHIRIGDNFSLYAYFFKFPGINSMRVLNRFMNVELFLLLLILGFAFRKYNKLALALLFILLVIDNSFDPQKIVRESKAELIQRKNTLVLEIRRQNISDKKIIALVDTITPAYISHIDMMLATQAIGIKTINGYSGYCPDAYGEFFLNCSEKGLTKWLKNKGIARNQILIIRNNNNQ